MDGLEGLNYDDLTTVAKLTSEPHYQSVMQVRTGCKARHLSRQELSAWAAAAVTL
jgi:hypothetical protein